MSEQAYSVLVELEALSKQNATRLPTTQEVQATWSGIGFRMGHLHFVAQMNEVSEVIEVPAFRLVPGVKSWVKGIANVGGRLLPIIDLTSFFQATGTARESNRKIIVVDKGEMYSGLLVDEILGMQHFEVEGFKENIESCDRSIEPFVSGVYHKENQVWHLFKLFELAEDPKFLQAAIS